MDCGWRNANVFTPSQWRELEEQAVIFNCISLGLPIPNHLLLSLRKNRFLPPMGWGCFQLGLSGRAEDLEPGRCRRTDGKKWRCSRMACRDSKYCERHLHRGKNRLRKRREASLINESPASVLPWCFQGDKQGSSSGTSGLIFKHCFELDSDLRIERSVECGDGGDERPISLHCFFDERPEKIEEDERVEASESQRRTEDFTVLLDLNV